MIYFTESDIENDMYCTCTVFHVDFICFSRKIFFLLHLSCGAAESGWHVEAKLMIIITEESRCWLRHRFVTAKQTRKSNNLSCLKKIYLSSHSSDRCFLEGGALGPWGLIRQPAAFGDLSQLDNGECPPCSYLTTTGSIWFHRCSWVPRSLNTSEQ